MKKSVLIIAYACEPGASSEPGVGWHMSCEAAKYFAVTVITRANNRDAIEAWSNAHAEAMPAIDFVYTDLARVFTELKKKMAFGTQLYYIAWQWKAMLVASRLCKRRAFDLLHHVTFGVSWLAPPAALLPGAFVWGPIGGGDLVPGQIMRHESWASRSKEIAYATLVGLSYRLLPLAWFARRRSRAILFRNRSTESSFPATDPSRRHVICETATESEVVPRDDQDQGELNAICVGRMQYWKGFRYAVEGFRRYLELGGTGTLTLLGDGPEMAAIRRYCEKHRLCGKVRILGQVPGGQVPEYLSRANVLIHPSFRDGGSWAVLEGMTHGLPVIAVDYSGSADMVNEDCGFLLQGASVSELVEEIAESLLKLERRPALRRQLGRAAQERVAAHYRWPVRGEQLHCIYNSILGEEGA